MAEQAEHRWPSDTCNRNTDQQTGHAKPTALSRNRGSNCAKSPSVMVHVDKTATSSQEPSIPWAARPYSSLINLNGNLSTDLVEVGAQFPSGHTLAVYASTLSITEDEAHQDGRQDLDADQSPTMDLRGRSWLDV